SPSTKTWFEGFSPVTTDRNRTPGGPSWLTFIGHLKESLWSLDMFRCESATLRTHWVLVVMDQYTRRIMGFGVHAGASMVSLFVGCSTTPFDGNSGCRSTSAPIMIPFIGLSSGK